MSPLLALPAVDGVEITTVMDNSLDMLMSSTQVAHRFPISQQCINLLNACLSTRLP